MSLADSPQSSEKSFGEGRQKGRSGEGELERGLDDAIGTVVPATKEHQSQMAGIRAGLNEQTETHSGSGGGGGGGGAAGGLLFFLMAMPFWLLVGSFYLIMWLFEQKPSEKRAIKITWGFLGVLFSLWMLGCTVYFTVRAYFAGLLIKGWENAFETIVLLPLLVLFFVWLLAISAEGMMVGWTGKDR
jgi:hypothetical protein